MKARAHGVSVTLATGRTIDYLWATGLKVDKMWDLHIFHGRRQRVYHPAGEWASFRCISAVPPAAAPRATLPAINAQDDATRVRPALQLDRQFPRTIRRTAEQEAR